MKNLLKWSAAALLLISGGLIVSCGEDVCVAGIGACDRQEVKKDPSLNTLSSETNLYLTYSSPKVNASNKLQFSSSGGKAPREFSVVEGGGTIDSNGLFTAPTTTGYSIIQVEDAEHRIKQIAVIIQ